MMLDRRWALPLIVLLLCLTGQGLGAEPAEQAKDRKAEAAKQEFLRLVFDKNKVPLTLESAVVTCAPRERGKDGPTVDLVSALHIADKGYYEELNRLFATYDVVLYELVAPKGTRIPRGGAKSDHPVSQLQMGLTRVLDLAFQLDSIDYTRENMVHADMSPSEFSESMKKRGDSFFTILMRMMTYAMTQQGETVSDVQLLAALFNPNRALALKRLMAQQFRDMEGSITAIEGPKGSTLIADRNQVALKELRKVVGEGKKKIAIFYGAAHMPNFEKHLRDDFGLAPAKTRWLVAWNMKDTKAKSKTTSKPERAEPVSAEP